MTARTRLSDRSSAHDKQTATPGATGHPHGTYTVTRRLHAVPTATRASGKRSTRHPTGSATAWHVFQLLQDAALEVIDLLKAERAQVGRGLLTANTPVQNIATVRVHFRIKLAAT